MASSSSARQRTDWTAEKNKLFEDALAIYDMDAPDRWQIIAKFVGGTSEEEVKRHYQILLHDIARIESDKVPLPAYRDEETLGRELRISDQGERLKQLRISIKE